MLFWSQSGDMNRHTKESRYIAELIPARVYSTCCFCYRERTNLLQNMLLIQHCFTKYPESCAVLSPCLTETLQSITWISAG